jgi:hypothetical protein
MWVFTTIGFYSAVASSPGTVMVRARDKTHLEVLIEKHLSSKPEIITSPNADYRYRIIVPKTDWITAMIGLTTDVDYSNFKDETHRIQGQNVYVEALHDVWKTMYRVQTKSEHKEERK